MIRVNRERSTPKCVVIEGRGKVGESDLDGARAAVDEAIAAAGDSGAAVVVYVESLVNPDSAQALEAMAQYAAHAGTGLKRMAIVSDLPIPAHIAITYSLLFSAEQRMFNGDQLDEAIAWANTGD